MLVLMGKVQTSISRRRHCPLLASDSLKVVFVDDSTSYLLKEKDSISINILHQNNYKHLDFREDDPVPTDRFVYFLQRRIMHMQNEQALCAVQGSKKRDI